jgi:hypothetical protein
MPQPFKCPSIEELPAPPAGKAGWPWTNTGQFPVIEQAAGTYQPTVAVVTPSYQQAEFIEETIRSVLLQGYPKLNYAILDGGSTDGSVAIIEKYRRWLSYCVSEPDGGQAQAIDNGFQRVEGEILVWLNSDDLFAPGAVWHAVQAFERSPEAVLIYGGADEIARDGTLLGPVKCIRQADRQYMVQVEPAIAQPSAYFRRAAYEAAGRLDHSLNWTMDYDLWVRMTEQGAIIIPETLAQLRIYPEAKTSLGVPAMFDEYRRVGDRYGGYALLNQMLWMVPGLLHKAMAALGRGDTALGQAWLTSVVANDPSWRSVPRLAEKLAGETWRRMRDAGEDTQTALQWARQICRGLPVKYISPQAVERRMAGLVYAALAFDSFSKRKSRWVLDHAGHAVREDIRLVGNRGLWSIVTRSLLNRWN